MPTEGKQPATDEKLPPFRLSEMGHSGLAQINGVIYEEMRNDLIWPNNIATYKKMSYDPTISAAHSVINVLVDRVAWEFYVPEDASAASKKACDFLNHCLNNLATGTWQQFINDIGSYKIYGFSVAEKVYGKQVGGKWAGKYIWKKLASRAQSTLTKWIFSKDTRELLGVRQSTAYVQDKFILKDSTLGYIDIPREKFILFSYDSLQDNPEGCSPLRGAYIPWKYKCLIEEYEAVGVNT